MVPPVSSAAPQCTSSCTVVPKTMMKGPSSSHFACARMKRARRAGEIPLGAGSGMRAEYATPARGQRPRELRRGTERGGAPLNAEHASAAEPLVERAGEVAVDLRGGVAVVARGRAAVGGGLQAERSRGERVRGAVRRQLHREVVDAGSAD